MSLEIELDRSKPEVHEAIMQFAARRACRMTFPWYVDGPRVERPADADSFVPPPPPPLGRGGLLWHFIHAVRRSKHRRLRLPRIDIEFSRSRGKTLLKIQPGPHTGSVNLAYGLITYLRDDRAYRCEVPLLCPRCSATVTNMTARFCGRCGHAFSRDAAASQARPRRFAASPEAESILDAGAPETDPEAAKVDKPAVVVEREPAAAVAESDPPSRSEEPPAPEPPIERAETTAGETPADPAAADAPAADRPDEPSAAASEQPDQVAEEIIEPHRRIRYRVPAED